LERVNYEDDLTCLLHDRGDGIDDHIEHWPRRYPDTIHGRAAEIVEDDDEC
jgi:hypothetical protein